MEQKSDKPEQPAELSPQESLAQAQADAEKWAKIAAHPSLNPKASAWAADQARSARASMKLWQKAIAYQQDNPDADPNRPEVSPSLRGPLPFSDLPSLISSTKPGTSGSTT